jgi:hypothetical protein
MAQRYGAPAPWRRRAALVATVVLAVVAGLLVAWAAWTHATPEARSELVGFTVTDEHEVVADVQVQLSERASGVQCVLRALAEDKSAVGEAVFTPDSSGRLSIPIRTERRATAVEKVGCTAEGQKRPR